MWAEVRTRGSGCGERNERGDETCACHEKVKTRCGNEGGDEADEVVVHIARKAKSVCRRAHDSGYKRVDLSMGGEGWRVQQLNWHQATCAK